MSARRLCSAVAISAAVCLSAAMGAESTLLRLTLDEGASHRYAFKQVQDMLIDIGAMGQQSVRNEMKMEMTHRVAAANPDGSFDVDVTYDRVATSMSAPGMTVTFDSAEPSDAASDDPMALAQRVFVGKTIGVTMSPRGKVGEVRGHDAIRDELRGQLQDNPLTDQILDTLDSSLGEDGFRMMMQQGQPLYPEQAVAPGDGWTQDVELDHAATGRMVVSTTYEVLGIEEKLGRDCLRLGIVTSLSVDGSIPMMDTLSEMFAQQGTTVDIDWNMDDATGEGTMWVERSSGLTVATELRQEIHIDMTMSMFGPSMPEPTEMIMSMDLSQTTGLALDD